MIIAIAAVLLPALASASPALPPLPGYAAPAARAEEFAPSGQLLGEVEDPLEALTAYDADLRDSVISPPSAAWLMGGLRSPNAADRLSAIHSAAIPRHAAAVPPITTVLLSIDEKPAIRAAAATTLGVIGDDAAAPSLSQALTDPSAEVRYAAALALGRLRVDGTATRLSRVLRTDPSWWVRYAAVLGLGRSKQGFVVGALSECLNEEPKWQVRMLAVRSLQDVGGPRAAEAVARGLRDADSGVRTAAALALGELGTDAHLHYLSAALKDETDASARDAQSAAFRRILAKN